MSDIVEEGKVFRLTPISLI